MGASNADSASSSATLNGSSRAPPRTQPFAAAYAAPGKHVGQHSQDLGSAEDRQAQNERAKRAHGIEVRPHREQAERAGEVFGPRKLVLHPERQRGEQEQQPYRRRNKGEDPRQQVEAAHPVQTFRAQHAGVLQVPLAPATVADGQVDQRGWAGLVRPCRSSATRTLQPARRSRAASTKSWLRMGPPSGGRPGSSGSPHDSMNARDTDEGVVSPEVPLASRPPRQTRRQHRSVDPCGELLQARHQGRPFMQARNGLDQAGVGIVLHAPHELDDGRPLHQAVRVQHQEVIVGAAPALAELADVAGLVGGVAFAPAIVDRRALAQAAA